MDQAPDPQTPSLRRGERRAWAAKSQPGHVAFAVPKDTDPPWYPGSLPCQNSGGMGWGLYRMGSPRDHRCPGAQTCAQIAPEAWLHLRRLVCPQIAPTTYQPQTVPLLPCFCSQRLRGHPRSSVSISGEHPLPPTVL